MNQKLPDWTFVHLYYYYAMMKLAIVDSTTHITF